MDQLRVCSEMKEMFKCDPQYLLTWSPQHVSSVFSLLEINLRKLLLIGTVFRTSGN